MEAPADLRHLVVQWLSHEADVAAKFSSKAAMQYGRALESLKKYPAPVRDMPQLLDLQFFGPKIVERLEKRLRAHWQENGWHLDPALTVAGSRASETASTDAAPTAKRRKTATARKYVPQKRSGGYAIMLALYVHDAQRRGMTKDDIIAVAPKYCDQSFHANPSTNQFYSAWTSSKTLINKDLIYADGRPSYYYLTDEGEKLAELLASADGIAARRPAASPQSAQNDAASGAELSRFEGHGFSVWEADSFDVCLMIDNREIRSQKQRDYFAKTLQQMGVDCATAALSVGDGLWVAKRHESGTLAVLDFIMERKRLDDLASSIKDGRYLEQKTRLKKTGITHVYYVVEEATASDVSTMGDAIQTSIATNITNSDFFTKRTQDSDDTVQALFQLTQKIQDFYCGKALVVIERPSDIKFQADYQRILDAFRSHFDNDSQQCVYKFDVFQDVLGKSDLTTVREMYIRMLMTVKGVSLDKAVSIQKRFPTPRALVDAYAACSTDTEREVLLSTATADEVGNKKIGAALSRKVFETWAGQDGG